MRRRPTSSPPPTISIGRRDWRSIPSNAATSPRRRLGDAGGGRARVRRVGVGREHVLRYGEHHRPRPPGHCGVEGTAHVLGDALGVVDLGHPLRHLAVHAAVVHLLERLAVHHPAAHLADDEDERGRVLERDVDPGRRVRRPRPAGDHAHPGPAGELAVRLGHHRRSALLAAHHGGDAGEVVQPVEHREKALAGHQEDPIAALNGELVGEDPPAVPKVPLRHRRTSDSAPRRKRPTGGSVRPARGAKAAAPAFSSAPRPRAAA